MYSYNELRVATHDFHPDNKLGEGGFGVVYKGILLDKTHVAVKQLIKSKLVVSDFLNEVLIISGIRHCHLIQLKGCCLSGDQRILVYEYVDNKDLAQALWGYPSENNLEVNWSTRLKIIIGITRGLAYLHEELQPSIIHQDIKAPNILLDKNFNPKIADFGWRFFFQTWMKDKPTMQVTSLEQGYLSPEYASFGHISTTLDVFSFGVVILEIISGRKNKDFEKPPEQQFLLEWAWTMYETNELWHLVDPKLANESIMEEITQVIKIGLLCVQYMHANRPKMSHVVTMLLDKSQVDNVCIVAESVDGSYDTSHHANITSLCGIREEDSSLLHSLS